MSVSFDAPLIRALTHEGSYYLALDAFKSVGGNLGGLAQAISTVQESCKDSNLLGNFLENHDIPRFASYGPSLMFLPTSFKNRELTDRNNQVHG